MHVQWQHRQREADDKETDKYNCHYRQERHATASRYLVRRLVGLRMFGQRFHTEADSSGLDRSLCIRIVHFAIAEHAVKINDAHSSHYVGILAWTNKYRL